MSQPKRQTGAHSSNRGGDSKTAERMRATGEDSGTVRRRAQCWEWKEPIENETEPLAPPVEITLTHGTHARTHTGTPGLEHTPPWCGVWGSTALPD